jgi:cadmium resistance transport/sequestration family protein
VIETIITSILAFVSTNIDDVFVLMLFYGSRKYTSPEIVLGQYIGIAVIVVISFFGAYIGGFFDQRYVGLLGIFPIYLAVRQFIALWQNEDDDDKDALLQATGMLSLAGVTIANGGDNIGIYIPLFITFTLQQNVVLITVFAALIYPMCLAAKYLSRHPFVAKSLDRYSHVVMPIVLLFLGVFIIYENESLSLLVR